MQLCRKSTGWPAFHHLTNSTILELTELPEHLAIVGGSYIALEFAQMFRRFGSRVTVLVRGDRVLAREDKDFAVQVQKVMSREGVEFLINTEASKLEPAGKGIRITLKDQMQDQKSIEVSHLLFATGRTPNTDDLWAGARGHRLEQARFDRCGRAASHPDGRRMGAR